MIKCTICYDVKENVGALPCGHIFCLSCLERNFLVATSCPKCRIECSPNMVLTLYPDLEEVQTPMTQNFLNVNEEIPRIEHLIEHAAGLGIESHHDELSKAVGQGETLLLRLQQSGNQEFMAILERLTNTLDSLRNKLKYSMRLTSAKDDNSQNLALIQVKDEQIRKLIHDLLATQRQRDDSKATVRRLSEQLAETDDEWRKKYQRLKDRYTHLEQKSTVISEADKANLRRVQIELKKQNAKIVRLKKKGIALQRERQQAATSSKPNARNEYDDDDDLVIIDAPIPGSFPMEPQQAITADADMDEVGSDSDRSSRSDPFEVEEVLTPRRQSVGKESNPQTPTGDRGSQWLHRGPMGREVSAANRVTRVRNQGVREGWMPPDWARAVQQPRRV